MLETLSKGFKSARLKLREKSSFKEDNIKEAMKEVDKAFSLPMLHTLWQKTLPTELEIELSEKLYTLGSKTKKAQPSKPLLQITSFASATKSSSS